MKSLFNKKSSSKKAIPTPPAHANFQPEAYQDDDVDYDPPPMIAAPLERKRSMSKPTDLDEILRLQEEEEQRNVNNIFANDPFFNQNSGQPALPKRSPNPPSEVSFAPCPKKRSPWSGARTQRRNILQQNYQRTSLWQVCGFKMSPILK